MENSNRTPQPIDEEAERRKDAEFFTQLPRTTQTTEELREATAYRLPPLDWRDGDAYVFLGFVLHFHESHCSCGAISRWSKPMRIFGHRTLEASRARRFVPFETGKLPHGEPMAIYELPIESTCVCHVCISAQAGDENLVRLRVATDERNWFYALMEDQRRINREARAARERSTKPSVSDDVLLAM